MASRQPGKAKKLDVTASSRELYGAELRYKREQAGLTLEEMGAMLFVSKSHVSNLEVGQRRIQLDMAKELDRILNTDGFFVRNLEAGRSSPHREDFADVAELETFAVTIRQWEPLLVPGLLQTEAYALAVILAYDPVLAESLVRQRLQARLCRAVIFDSPTKPLYWAVVHEAAIRTWVGNAAVMAEQLRHIAGMVRRRRIVFQVLPFRSGALSAMNGGLRLMTFKDDTPLAYLSSVDTGVLIDNPATVKRHMLSYDFLGAAALPPEASLTLIEAAAEEYEHASQGRPDGGDLA
ncbi:helix-turn-helix domain-containing protein [Actinacidiphila sp. ITFR-21]|uniref:helix-turn-helix domain-containing protein n=1 Tax=Actinacidiphila sp. ITFR-21 TaxID=3075199 RepID=UPI0028896E8A|nr:helix-turn-helix transcriptional regulator [Streptomyces sp. ITFR-21]WNI16023.1 helix-turn-helix transcriptional regulator [Streptomyces sp. ITFR-21]